MVPNIQAQSPQPQTLEQRCDDALHYLRMIAPEPVRFAGICCALQPRDPAEQWRELALLRAGFDLFKGKEHEETLEIIAASLVDIADEYDVFVCPFPHGPAGRKNPAAHRRLVPVDLDGEHDANLAEALGMVRLYSGGVTRDGVRKIHGYLLLDRSVSAKQLTVLCESVGTKLGRSWDSTKKSDDIVLRLPGTLNHKTNPPRPVEWLVRPTDSQVRVWAPDELARELKVELPPDTPVTSSGQVAWIDEDDETEKGSAETREGFLSTEPTTVSVGYISIAVSNVLDELSALRRLREDERNSRDQGWDKGSYAAACRLLELSNASPREYPREQAQTDFISGCPTSNSFDAKAVAHKWSCALEQVGDRPAEIPEHTKATSSKLDGTSRSNTVRDHNELEAAEDDVCPEPKGATRMTQTTAGSSPSFAFADIAAIIDGGLEAIEADGGPGLIDGSKRFYRGAVNVLFGDPETAKTLVALASGAQILQSGGILAFIDTDHNGPELVVRFLGNTLGLPREVLVERLRYAQPEEAEELLGAVNALVGQAEQLGGMEGPEVFVVLDSVGENLGLFGVSPNDDQGFIDMNRRTAARLARASCTVVTIDHLAKNTESRKYGATGSTAKKRAADGAVYRVQLVKGREFSPTTGGANNLLLEKDRRGGVRALGLKTGDVAARFELDAPDAQAQQNWRLVPGNPGPTRIQAKAIELAGDVEELRSLDPPPKSKLDVAKRMEWGHRRALDALQEWRKEQGEGDDNA